MRQIFVCLIKFFFICSYQSNQVIGLCPKCCDPTSSYFLQSIFTNGLFEMIAEGRPFKRESLFCLPCITAAKTNLLILQGKLKPASPTDGEHMLYYGTAQGDIISAGDISTDVNCLETRKFTFGLENVFISSTMSH